MQINLIAQQQVGPILETLQWWYDLFRKENLIIDKTPEEKKAELEVLKESVRKLGINRSEKPEK